jgi:hypothetical protein
MAYRNNSQDQARIFAARKKKAQQLRASQFSGVKAGAIAAQELIKEGYSEVYEFTSLVLHRLNMIEAEDRVLRGSDMEKSYCEIREEAKALLPSAPSEDLFIAVSIRLVRSANEAWVLHRDLTDIYRDDLSEERRSKLSSAITEKFPH